MFKSIGISLLLIQSLTGQTTIQGNNDERLPDVTNDPNLAAMIAGLKEIKNNYLDKKPTNFRGFTGSNLKSSTPEEAQRVSSFAGAAYCSTHTLTSWKCNHCERIGAGIQVKHIFEDLFTGGRGFLALDEAKKQIIVSFRGSYNIQNWVGNARFLQSQYLVENGGTDIYIHTGFKDGINALLPKFKNEFDTLLKEHGDFKVIVTGHSLGGAMATLASIELKKAFGLNWDRIELFTYGEPRVGNLAFAEWFNSQTLTVSRVVNDRDIVPHVPPRNFGYSQHHNEIFLNDGTTTICKTNTLEDPNCSLSNEPFLLISDHLLYYNGILGGLC